MPPAPLSILPSIFGIPLVPETGFEPVRPKRAQAPKACASAYSATPAIEIIITIILAFGKTENRLPEKILPRVDFVV